MSTAKTVKPTIPVQTRSERPTSTKSADFPSVTGREHVWKFVPVDRLRDFFQTGQQGEPLPCTITGTGTYSEQYIHRDNSLIGSAGMPEERASACAWESFNTALHIKLDDNSRVRVNRSGLGKTLRAAHTVIEVRAGAHAHLLIQGEGAAKLNENIEILLEEDAHLTLVSVQTWAEDTLHLASHYAKLAKNAQLKHVVVTLGGEIARVNPAIHLNGAGSACEALGAYFADSGQHLEHQVYIDHAAPNTRSRVTYKGALRGKNAHTAWIGDVLIRREAKGTDSYEENRNLVLTPGTRADSIPNLEIETGDIQGAGHASATGRFDEEHLFYLMSRGISDTEARRLVVHGFLTEIISQVDDEETENTLRQLIEAELEESEN